ncbi:MAG: hypothetical protein NTY79_03730 [Chloroflexi bacterium]|nr:hypothetical protein [Chloroflexota bacterium]
MVEVVVGKQNRLYSLLLIQRQRGGQASGIQRYLIIYQQAGQPAPVGLGIMRAEDLDFHLYKPPL